MNSVDELFNDVENSEDDFQNAGGAIVGAITSAVGSATSSIADLQRAKIEAKAQKDSDRMALIQSLIDRRNGVTSNKKNYLPIIIIGSVFLVGSVIAIVVLRRK